MATNKKILIAEDEGIVSLEIKETLENLGYTVVGEAQTGLEALKMAEKLSPDLVLMDIILQGDIDGIEAAERVYSLYDIPVIFLTAHSDEATLKRALKTNAFGYLIKPFNERELYSNIEMTLHKHRILKKVGSPGETVEKTLVLVSDAVVTTDTRGNITRINPPAESLTGWMRGDVLGFDIFSIFELDQGKVLGLMDSVRNDSFERRTMLSWADGLSLKKKSGDKIPVSMNIGFIKGNKWEPDEFFFVIIPDDVKDENGECRLERYYRIVMDLMNNSVFMINSDMKIVVYNQAFLDLCANIGISLEKLDKPVYEILPSEIFGKKWDYQEIFDNGSSYRMERTYKNEKTVRYLTIETIPLSDNNSITHAAFIGSDTTREKEIEEKEERISMNFKAHSENVEEIADLCARIKMPLGKIRKISESSASADLKNISAAASEISEILLDIDLKWLKYEKIKTFFDLIKESSSGGEKKEEA